MAEDNKTDILLERALEYLKKDEIKDLKESVEENTKRQEEIKEALKAVQENDKMIAEAHLAALEEDGERTSELSPEVLSVWKTISKNISGLYGIAKKDALEKSRSIRKQVTSGDFQFEEVKFGDAFDALGLSAITRIIKDVGKAFKSLGPVLRNIGKLFLKFIVRPLFLFTKTTLLPIVGAIGTAIAAFGPLLAVAASAVGAVLESVNFMKDEIANGGNLIQVGIAGVVGAFTGAINVFLGFADTLSKAFGNLLSKFLGDDNPIVKFFQSANMKDAFTDAMKKVVVFFNETIPDFFKDMIEKASNWISDKFESLKVGFDVVWTGVKNVFADWKASFLKDWDTIKTFLTNVKDGFVELFGNLRDGANDLWQGIKATGVSIKEQFLSGWQSVKDFSASAAEWFSELFAGLIDGAVNLWEGIKATGTSIRQQVLSGWQSVKDFFTPVADWFSKLFDGLVDGANNLWTGIKETATSIKEQFMAGWSAFGDFLSSIPRWFTDMFTGIKEVASEKWESIKQFASDIGDQLSAGLQKIKDFFSSIPRWFESKFTDIKQAASEGLETVTDLASKVTEIAKKIVRTPFDLVQNAFTTLMEKLSWEKVKATVSDINPLKGIGSGIKDFARNFAKAAAEKFTFLKYVPGFKDLLEEPAPPALEEVTVAAQRKSDAELADAMLNEIDVPQRDRKVVNQNMAEEMLVDMGYLDADDPRLARNRPGNLGSALNPAPAVPSSTLVTPAPASGAITGLERAAAAQTAEMTARQQGLDNARAETQYGPMRDAGNTAIIDNADYSTTTYNQIMNAPQPTSTDRSDPFMFYQATGNSR